MLCENSMNFKFSIQNFIGRQYIDFHDFFGTSTTVLNSGDKTWILIIQLYRKNILTPIQI